MCEPVSVAVPAGAGDNPSPIISEAVRPHALHGVLGPEAAGRGASHMAKRIHTHERLDLASPAAGGSDRGFGLLFAVVLAGFGLFPLLGGGSPRGQLLAFAGALLAVALFRARWLAPFNRVWFKLGLLLHRIASPVVMAVIYFAVVTPTGLIMRALGKDPLRLDYDPEAESYWIHRDPPGPERESMTNQF